MSFDEFYKKYNDKTKGYPTDNDYNGECLSLVKLYIKETYNISPPPSGVNSAYGYWTNFPAPLSSVLVKIPNTNDITPVKGDIMVWNNKVGGGYGHIAICTGNNTGTQYFESFDQNWGGRQAHLVNHNYNNVYGVLRSKGVFMPDPGAIEKQLEECQNEQLKNEERITSCRADREALYTNLNTDSLQGAISAIGGLRARITDLGNQLGEYQAEVKNREEQVSRLKDEVLTLEDDKKVLYTRLQEQKNKTNEFAKEKGTLAIEVGQLKKQVESLKLAQTEGGITITLSEFFKLLFNHKITIRKS